jgi:hypothetical protein
LKPPNTIKKTDKTLLSIATWSKFFGTKDKNIPSQTGLVSSGTLVADLFGISLT